MGVETWWAVVDLSINGVARGCGYRGRWFVQFRGCELGRFPRLELGVADNYFFSS